MISEIKHLLTTLDNYMFAHVHPYINEANTNLMLTFSFLASHYFLLPANILMAAYFLFIRKNRWAAIRVIAVGAGSVLLMFSLKYYFRRVRPDHPVHEAASGYSFPSGHSMSAMTFYGLIIYFIFSMVRDKRLQALLAVFLSLLIMAIGFSRIYLRVHYASDVLGGFVIGYLWLAISLWTLKQFDKRIST